VRYVDTRFFNWKRPSIVYAATIHVIVVRGSSEVGDTKTSAAQHNTALESKTLFVTINTTNAVGKWKWPSAGMVVVIVVSRRPNGRVNGVPGSRVSFRTKPRQFPGTPCGHFLSSGTLLSIGLTPINRRRQRVYCADH